MKETFAGVTPVEKPAKKEKLVTLKNELNQELAVALPGSRWMVLDPNGYRSVSEEDAASPHVQDLIKAGYIALT